MAVEYDSNGIPILSNKAYLSDTPSYTQALAQNLTDLVEIIVPIGMIQAVAGDTTSMLPYWLPCDGTIVPPDSRYDELRTRIGHTYGSEYRLPDLQGRTLIGAGQGATLTNRTLGQKVGNERHTLSVNEMPSHNHDMNYIWSAISGLHLHDSIGTYAPGQTNYAVNSDTAKDGASPALARGGGAAHNNVQPSLVINYVILAARE